MPSSLDLMPDHPIDKMQKEAKKNGFAIDDWFVNKFRLFPASKCSGSPQPAEYDFGIIIETAKVSGIKAENIVILDLREEAHFFQAGTPIQHETETYISEFEYAQQHNDKILNQHDILKPKYDLPKPLSTEKELVERQGANYQRLPVSNHGTPSAKIVDEFVKLALQLITEGKWLHIHCHGGKGRTTTFIDMYKQIRQVVNPSEGIEIDPMAEKKLSRSVSGGSEKEDSAEKLARVAFIESFSAYIRDVKDHGGFETGFTPWSEWKKQQEKTEKPS